MESRSKSWYEPILEFYSRKWIQNSIMNTNTLEIPLENLGYYYIPNEVYGGIAVDIGSNVGSFLKKSYHIFSKIHYYEPIKQCFDICHEFAKNYPHIVGYNLAVSNGRRACNIVMHKNHMAGSSALDCLSEDIVELEHSDRTVINSVNTITLDDVYETAGGFIDYCKCDCEISEYDIFMHQDMNKINYLAIEMHWQMGEKRYSDLMQYILKTHDIIYGNTIYPGIYDNRELLFRKKK